jgi:hypothetical protein
MLPTYLDARNDLFAQLLTVKPAVETVLGYPWEVVYQGVMLPDKVPTDKVWSRISQQTVLEEQATLSGNDLKRRYTTDGLVFVQIFIPQTYPQDYGRGLQVAELVKTAYRGKNTDNCMWFRNTRIQELPPETAWFRINVVSEYTYDQIG